MSDPEQNPLLSTTRALDGSSTVQLHPLVLLTISDHITRHALRNQEGPIVGAILGQQNGREVTMEVAFACKMLAQAGEGSYSIDDEWFRDRLEQFKEVHKAPALDLVGWFTLGSSDGPKAHHIPVHEYMSTFNEAAVALLFDARATADRTVMGGKLPVQIYESLLESTSAKATDAEANEDEEMQIEGAETKPKKQQLKFRELAYTVETSGTEMIAMDFVAKGGAGASVVSGSADEAKDQSQAKSKGKGKVKGKGKEKEEAKYMNELVDIDSIEVTLAPDEEELISSLNAKINAIKMLHSRLKLISAYLASIPPCYLTKTDPDSSTAIDPDTAPHINHNVLRTISSMLSRLPLLVPPSAGSLPDDTDASIPTNTDDPDTKMDNVTNSNTTSNSALNHSQTHSSHNTTISPLSLSTSSPFTHQIQSQQSDVALVNLLASMTRSLAAVREVGQKHSVVEGARGGRKSLETKGMVRRGGEGGGGGSGGSGGGFAGSDEFQSFSAEYLKMKRYADGAGGREKGGARMRGAVNMRVFEEVDGQGGW